MFSLSGFNLLQGIHRYKSLLYKIFILFSSVICIVLCFSCTVSSKPITLTLLVQALEAPEWRPLIKEFEQRNPNIHIELIEGSDATDALEAAYIKSFRQRELHYDLVYMDAIWVARFAHEGWLIDLSDRLSKPEVAEFLPVEIESGSYNQRLYRLPFHADAGVLFYRKDLLDAIDRKPPETFDDLNDILQQLHGKKLQETKIPRWGYVWQGQRYEGLVATFIEVLHGHGGYWINDTLDIGLDQEPALKAVEFLRSTIYSEKPISPSSVATFQEEETLKIFKDGDAVFLRSWPYVWSKANVTDSPIQGNIAITRMVHAKGEKSSPCRGGWGLGIYKLTNHSSEALRAIRFFTSADVQRRHAMRTGNMPTRRSLFYDPLLVERYNYYPELLKILDDSIKRPSTPKYNEVSKILQEHLYEALRQKDMSRAKLQDIMQSAAQSTRDCLNASSVKVSTVSKIYGLDRKY